MTRDLTYEDRTAIYEALAHLRTAEHALILAIRSIYTTVAEGSFREARAYIDAALDKLAAAEAAIEAVPAPAAPAPSNTPVRLVPRFETAPPPTTGDAA